MQEAFGYVLFGTVIVGAVAAIVTVFFTGKAYDQIGKGGFFRDEDGPPLPPPGGRIDVAERDDEIRQMLTARNARRAAAGRPTVDVEAELARLTAAPVAPMDENLRGEIREHVQARNRRRIRRGLEPLDVDAEVERQVAELGGGQ